MSQSIPLSLFAVLAVFLATVSGCGDRARVLTIRVGMSYDDIASQDDDLAEEIADQVARGRFAHTTTYKRIEVLHPLRDQVMLTFSDTRVELGLFADWVTSIRIWKDKRISVSELQEILRMMHGLDFPCATDLGAVSPLMSPEARGQAPCELLSKKGEGVSEQVRCEALFEGRFRQQLTLRLECLAGAGPDEGEELRAHLDFGFVPSDGLAWARPRYEAKYGPLEVKGIAP